jgi:prepilin-type N-terminal cleavage/methylation domain-containing protein
LKNNSGFTLVELLVTIGLLTVITIVSSDFLLNLVSASVRIQNKATLEQNYSYISSKLVKMIEEADDVSIVNSSKMVIILDGISYTVELKNGQITINDILISSTENLTISSSSPDSTDAFRYSRSANPEQIGLLLKFTVDSGSKIEATQTLERIVTVRKSYKD